MAAKVKMGKEEKKNEAKVVIPEVLEDDVVTVFDRNDSVTGAHAKKDGKTVIVFVPNDDIDKSTLKEAVKERLGKAEDITKCSDTMRTVFDACKGKTEEQRLSEDDFGKEKPWSVRMKEFLEELEKFGIKDAVKEDKKKRQLVLVPVKIVPVFYEPVVITQQVYIESVTIIKNKDRVFIASQKLTLSQQMVAKGLQNDLFMEADTWVKKEFKQRKEKDGLKMASSEAYFCKVKYNSMYSANYCGFKETTTQFRLSDKPNLAKDVQDDLFERNAVAMRDAERSAQTAQVIDKIRQPKKNKLKFTKMKGFDGKMKDLGNGMV